MKKATMKKHTESKMIFAFEENLGKMTASIKTTAKAGKEINDKIVFPHFAISKSR